MPEEVKGSPGEVVQTITIHVQHCNGHAAEVVGGGKQVGFVGEIDLSRERGGKRREEQEQQVGFFHVSGWFIP
jgi:CRISPR/Cas system endoribonuclease Cas6 (RAMP superfamily)